jgi:hypothetical protein
MPIADSVVDASHRFISLKKPCGQLVLLAIGAESGKPLMMVQISLAAYMELVGDASS